MWISFIEHRCAQTSPEFWDHRQKWKATIVFKLHLTGATDSVSLAQRNILVQCNIPLDSFHQPIGHWLVLARDQQTNTLRPSKKNCYWLPRRLICALQELSHCLLQTDIPSCIGNEGKVRCTVTDSSKHCKIREAESLAFQMFGTASPIIPYNHLYWVALMGTLGQNI